MNEEDEEIIIEITSEDTTEEKNVIELVNSQNDTTNEETKIEEKVGTAN